MVANFAGVFGDFDFLNSIFFCHFWFPIKKNCFLHGILLLTPEKNLEVHSIITNKIILKSSLHSDVLSVCVWGGGVKLNTGFSGINSPSEETSLLNKI